MVRIVLSVALVAFVLAGCSPRPKNDPAHPTPPPGTTWPVVRNDAGMLETNVGVTVYRDGKSDFELTLPEGFGGRLSFTADSAGPPVSGAVKLRMTDGASPPCVIDVAVETPRLPQALAETIPTGRETFFLAETGEPKPTLPATEVWTATHVLSDSTRIDIGYWIFAPENLLRVEGRAPLARLSECKDAIDGVVRSLRSSLRPEAGVETRSPG